MNLPLTWVVDILFFIYGWIFDLDVSLSEARIFISWPHVVLSGFQYRYIDDKCHVDISRVDVVLPICPHPLRLLGGKSFGTVRLLEFKVQVGTSSRTPRWLERLRWSCIFTILNGNTIQLDDFKTTVTFNDDQGNTSVSEHSSQWHIHNKFNRRMYIFGEVNAVMHRNWARETGIFSMLAEDCEWNLLPANPQQGDWWKLGHQLLTFFPDVVPKFFDNPLTVMDLYISKCEVTFKHFRLHDAELVRQGGVAVKMNIDKARTKGVFDDFTWDMFMDAVIRICT